ncbi:MAG: SMC family ATPase [Bryobacteraceae bacterium]|jgi:exonuclease SbcC
MRPIRLELQGFTAFREKCEIDFSTFDLFAITGQTGAGKTSLLDAMTYSLYGKTSRLNKAGKDLISQGAAGMSVLLHFRAGSDEYKVARAIKGSTVTARLEKLQEGEWKGISGSIGEINDQVRRIVGLDFDGFTKAVILPQGKFDVFLRGKPDERRDVLNDLLDVRVYQRMMQSANEKSRLAGERAKVKETEIDPAATPEAKAEHERKLAEFVAHEKALEDVVDRLQTALPDALRLREKRNALLSNQSELVETQIKITAAEEAAANARQAAEREGASIEKLDRQITAIAYDSELHLKLTQLEQPALQRKKLNEEVGEQAHKREVEGGNLAEAEKKARAAHELLKTVTGGLKGADQSRGSKKAAHDELEARHGSAHAIEQVIKEIDTARAYGLEIPKIHRLIAEFEARADALLGAVDAAQKDLADAEAKVEAAGQKYEHVHARDRVAALRHELKPGEACPVCEQTVHSVPKGPDANEVLKAEQQLKAVKAGLKKAQEHVLAIRAEADGLPGKLDLTRQQLDMRESTLRSAIDQASQILGRPADESVTNELRLLIELFQTAKLAFQHAQSHYEKMLGDERDASCAFQDAEHKRQLILSQIDNIEKLSAACRDTIAGLDEVLQGAPPLQEITSQLKTLKAAKQKRDELEEARKKNEKALKQAEELVVRCAKDTEALENVRLKCAKSIEDSNKEITKLGKQVRKKLGGLELVESPDEAEQIERLQVGRRKDLENAQARVQQCHFTIQALAEKIANNERLRGEVAQQKAEEALYRDLGTWLNAGNFQQYLLSSAFELLATEGSKHLKALSNDRYTFAYRDKEFEVIDKWNGEETRSVNTLSGGESFLASLALALALAGSIAELNSAGGAVALESLFLDEGFSTLDTETLSKVADAIQLLQDGKRLIGIVTHVQSLADQMPSRIEVEKTIGGSRIRQPSESSAESG